jgi:hypothetical protein
VGQVALKRPAIGHFLAASDAGLRDPREHEALGETVLVHVVEATASLDAEFHDNRRPRRRVPRQPTTSPSWLAIAFGVEVDLSPHHLPFKDLRRVLFFFEGFSSSFKIW